MHGKHPKVTSCCSAHRMLDGITRHNPEGLWFRRHAQQEGFKAALQWRDGGQPIFESDEARALIREMEARPKPAG
ncbi:MAG: hypothetical protein ACREXN_07860 [Polaromonas sp.]